jgi:homoaconitase/3-isopropylmalate dehydratase large subunit
MTAMQFEMLGEDVEVAVPLAVMYVDHNVLQIDDKNMQDHRYLATFCERCGVRYSPPGHRISHYIHLERLGRPGEVLLGADSRTTTCGALGMFATGAGGLEVAVAMAGYGFELPCPRVIGVELVGRLPDPVEAKAVVLELLRRYGVREAAARCSSSSATAWPASPRRDGRRSATWPSRPERPRGSSPRTRRPSAGSGSRAERTPGSPSPRWPGPRSSRSALGRR